MTENRYNDFSGKHAGVAELADALDLGSSGSIPLEVQILSPAPLIYKGFLPLASHSRAPSIATVASISAIPSTPQNLSMDMFILAFDWR